MVDLVIRVEEASRLLDDAGDVKVAFYADDGRIGGRTQMLSRIH